MVANLEVAVAGIDHGNEVEHAAGFDAAVRRLDKTVIVDARIAAQRRDQADVRTFRRFNRADASVVRRMYVAHLESGALTRQTARSKRRKTPLVRDLRERVRLVHELGQLRRPEELANGRHHRFGVHQVVRHRRRHLLVDAHLFLDGPFHAHQSDAELVLHQLANRADAAVAEVIDIVHRADVLAQLEQVADGRVEIVRLQGAQLAVGGVGVVEQLDVELHAADGREVILPRIEKHSVEQRGRRIQRRRVAGAQLAVDFDQRFLRGLDRVAAQRRADDRAHVVALGEENVDLGDAGIHELRNLVGRNLRVGFQHDLARVGVDDVGRRVRAFQVAQINFDLAHLGLVDLLQDRGRNLAAGVRYLLAALADNAMAELHAEQVRRTGDARFQRPVDLLVLQREAVDRVEGAQNVFIGTQPQRAQENRSQELALAVDANIQNILLIVFEFHPRAAIGNDLSQEIRAVVGGLEKHAGGTVQLADDDALGAVDDEGAVLGHQRDVAEEDLLLLDIADGLVAGLGVFVEDGQPHGDLQRRAVGHAALFALGHVILQLQADGIAALVAEIGGIGVIGAALGAKHFARMERIGNHGCAAIAAGCAQMVQSLEVAALALPVADGVVDKLQLGDVAKIRDRKHGLKNSLQSCVITLARQPIHLQEAVVGALLHLDQVWNLDSCWNF